MEYHPRLDIENLIITQKKIILGSFPIWSLSDITTDSTETTQDKLRTRERKGDYQFFFGSSKNQFWCWYKKFFDQNILLADVKSIQRSLKNKNVGITDVILSCVRKGKSSLDKHLSNRKYNHSFFYYPKEGETLKILCTSKGVMNDMLLNNKFFKIHPNITYNVIGSERFQEEFIQRMNGNMDNLRKPFFCEMSVHMGGKIQCLSIPSPGSPYRKLNDFGIDATKLDDYLLEAFKWFKL